MSLVVVGLSYRTAPIPLLERASVVPDRLPSVLAAAAACPHVSEAAVLSTCNRVEVYADVRAFHTGVAEISALLAAEADVPVEELLGQLYVHYEDAVVQHAFQVVCGLDSMVVGEAQILGQVRGALRAAQRAGIAGRSVGGLLQQALRVGKRAHTETGIDRAGSRLVSTGLELAGQVLGGLPGRRALVVGAGSLSAIAVAELARAGVTDVVVANRGEERAVTLAASVGGRGAPLAELGAEIAGADLLVSCTGATGLVVPEADVAAAMATRPSRPLAVLDLALPRDVDPAVLALPGVTLVSLEEIGTIVAERDAGAEVEAVRAIVADEVGRQLARRQAARVAPTVVALRSMADEVVAAELARLDARRPGLDAAVRSELEQTVRRVVDKLLHAPTVRVKELAEQPAGLVYAEALHALFDLDPERYREVVLADLHAMEVELPEPTASGEPGSLS
jgi:glutamyl-tRNA reductase